jgi:hypothetical protein
MLYCCWTGTKDSWEACPSVEAPNLDVAMSFFLNSLLIRPPIQRKYKGTMYARFPGEPTFWIVFEEGMGPSLHRLRGARRAPLAVSIPS